LEGCLGEVAAAKALGVEGFRLSEGTYKRPDIVDGSGTEWHCRGTRRKDGRLKVGRRDPKSGRYILVIISPDYRSARVAGHCLGKMVECMGWFGDPTGEDREPCWWVQQRCLSSVAEYHERMAAKAAKETTSC
jgi:hypothetical protein